MGAAQDNTMNCPKCTGEIVFDVEEEECDSGDGPWLQTWTVRTAYINEDDSIHDDDCTLTEQEKEKIAHDKTTDLEGMYEDY